MIHDIHSRLVEVSRTTAGRGTGYAVAADLVLTAAHLVAHDDAVRVVTRDRQLAGNVVWRHPTLDAALVRVPGRPWQGIDTRWGKLSGVGSVTCTAVGYPRAQRTADGASVEEQLGGSIMPLTARSIDRYAINVTTALPRESRTSTSPWSGMSGAAVLSADGQHLLGLIIEYPNQFEPARLEAVPVAGLLADADFVELIRADPSALIALTDVSAGDAHPVASSRGLAQPWRARIESLDDGRVLGLGFLIDAAHVLTHAVAGHTRVRVVFPGVRTEATVISVRSASGISG